MKELTSEEKLLKLIRKKDSPAEEQKGPGEEVKAVQTAETPQPPKPEAKEGVDLLKFVNYFLIVVIIAIIAYILTNTGILKDTAKTALPAVNVKKEAVSEAVETVSLTKGEKPFSLYEQKISQRDLFVSPWEKPDVLKTQQSEVSFEARNSLKLVGIVVDDQPQAIIENIKENMTVFVGVGERVGEATVESIKEDKVILIYQGEKIELIP